MAAGKANAHTPAIVRRAGGAGWTAPDAAVAICGCRDEDLRSIADLHRRHRALGLGLVDAAVIVTAVRLCAAAIATLDLRHFGAVTIAGAPRLLPRDV